MLYLIFLWSLWLDFSQLLTNSSTLRLWPKSKINSKQRNKKLISYTVGQRKITSYILTKKSESGGELGPRLESHKSWQMFKKMIHTIPKGILVEHSRMAAAREDLTPTLMLQHYTTTALKKGTSTLKLVSKLVKWFSLIKQGRGSPTGLRL